MDDKYELMSAAVSDRGLSEKRPQNEDSFLEIPECGIFAVADGVGGAQAGEVASQMAVEILGEAFMNRDPGSDAEEVMREALEKANAAIHQMSTELEQLSQMATTIVALHLAGNIASIAHVGDSRLYSLKRNGEFTQETADHSMVAEEVRAGRMTEEQAENHPGKNIINRALGAEPTVQIDLKTMMIEPGTRFMLCSDGVTRHVDDAELSDLLNSDNALGTICETIKQICYERGAEDNLTAVLVDLNSEVAHEDIGALPEPVAEDILDIDDDEPTVTLSRPQFDASSADEFEDELLELDTLDMSEGELDDDQADVIPVEEADIFEEVEPQYIGRLTEETLPEPSESDGGTTPGTQFTDEVVNEGPSFSMYRDSESFDESDTGGGGLGKIASTVALLLVGAIVGLLGSYFYLTNQAPPEESIPTDKVSISQPLAGFEEDRRMVDRDPAAAIPNYVNGASEAEDYFLLGRAYLLTGKFPEARSAFLKSRNLIGEGRVDPSNKKTLENEIALAMAVTNDTTVQGILQKEIDALKAQQNGPAANSSNSNASTVPSR